MEKENDEKCECEGKGWKYSREGKWHHGHRRGMKGSGIYCVGMIGVAVYYIQQVHGFWPVVVAVLKAMVWPAFLLYHVFQMLHM